MAPAEAAEAPAWGYHNVADWPRLFPAATGGRRQSPIDILTPEGGRGQLGAPELAGAQQKTRLCATGARLQLAYPRFTAHLELWQTGHGWQAAPDAELALHTRLAGPPFEGRHYRLAQLHGHWGGSEHRLNGRAFGGELHFVHWDSSRFASFEEACGQRRGLAVLAVFLEGRPGAPEQAQLAELARALRQLPPQPGPRRRVAAHLDLKRLMPPHRHLYATYDGSLTTPPLAECVHWLVFLEPLACSPQQLLDLAGPQAAHQSTCRPVQATNGREVSLWSRAVCGER